jgi:hypothetical protein
MFLEVTYSLSRTSGHYDLMIVHSPHAPNSKNTQTVSQIRSDFIIKLSFTLLGATSLAARK